jgi:hypothetical protein
MPNDKLRKRNETELQASSNAKESGRLLSVLQNSKDSELKLRLTSLKRLSPKKVFCSKTCRILMAMVSKTTKLSE